MIVITTGDPYTDIDAYACALAYRDLLRLRGVEAEVALPGFLNQSITPLFKAMGADVMLAPSREADGYVVVDISEPDYIAKFVDQARVTELYDHHFGFEEHWKTRLGENSHIEPVGASATLIWEQYKKFGFEASLTANNANLLAVGIISNTLNFESSMTHERDRVAFAELQKYISLPAGWIADYFKEMEKGIFEDIEHSIAMDTKALVLREFDMPMTIGQIELWDGSVFIFEHLTAIKKVLSGFGKEHWFMSVPSISEN